MDKKKLIGTIIGVIFFVALIAGATFAWLTFNANVTNGNYNTMTGNFIINYTKGDKNISSVPIISVADAASVATSDAEKVVIKAGKNSTNMPNGKFTMKLKTVTDNTTLDLTNGALKYAVSVAGAAPTAINSVTSTSDIVLVQDYTLSSTTQVEFAVYFWLDAGTITSDDMAKTYSGYIDASAVQLES